MAVYIYLSDLAASAAAEDLPQSLPPALHSTAFHRDRGPATAAAKNPGQTIPVAPPASPVAAEFGFRGATKSTAQVASHWVPTWQVVSRFLYLFALFT